MFRVEGLQSSESGQDKKLLRIEKTYGARGAQLERIPSHHPYQKTHMESQSIFLPMSIAHLRRKAHFCVFSSMFGVWSRFSGCDHMVLSDTSCHLSFSNKEPPPIPPTVRNSIGISCETIRPEGPQAHGSTHSALIRQKLV